MAGIIKGYLNTGHHLVGAFIPNTDEIFQTFNRIGHGVIRFKERFTFTHPFPVKIFNVILLNFSAVAEHKGAEVPGSIGANNVALKATFDEVGNITAVIDVSMREDEGINFGRIIRQVLVAGIALFPAALE